MPLTLDDPRLTSLMAACYDEKASDEFRLQSAHILADWLFDQNATIHNVIQLFRGTPPKYLDGIPQHTLVMFLMHYGFGELAAKIEDVAVRQWQESPTELRYLEWKTRILDLVQIYLAPLA